MRRVSFTTTARHLRPPVRIRIVAELNRIIVDSEDATGVSKLRGFFSP